MARVPMTSMNPIKRARQERGITQAQLADEVGVKQQSISRWEQSHGRPEPEHMESLQAVLHLSLEDMATLAKIPYAAAGSLDITASSIGTIVLAADEIGHKMRLLGGRIIFANGQDMRTDEREHMLITAKSLIEGMDELRPRLVEVIERCNEILDT